MVNRMWSNFVLSYEWVWYWFCYTKCNIDCKLEKLDVGANLCDWENIGSAFVLFFFVCYPILILLTEVAESGKLW